VDGFNKWGALATNGERLQQNLYFGHQSKNKLRNTNSGKEESKEKGKNHGLYRKIFVTLHAMSDLTFYR